MEYEYVTKRTEWLVVRQQVDQYGRNMGEYEVVSIHPTRGHAVMDQPNHGKESEFVKGRWMPFNGNGYEIIEITCRAVEVERVWK